ncbi:KIF13B [Symbiodinium necroappetens]|uniref:KIF13B protein n=1 Tax=Symbiodinium necroappetens TaxID=1628268 RepID=A0A812YFB5_9DINO|nr:KIF13B [Symbiodinium necroappetens]
MLDTGDGMLEERLLDFLTAAPTADWEPSQLLVLRLCSQAWRDKVSYALFAGCSQRLANEDAQVRAAAVSALAAASNPRRTDEDESGENEACAVAVAAAVKSLKDASVDVRRVALRTLAHVAPCGDAACMEQASALLTDPAWPVRWASVDAVAWLAQGGSQATVQRALELLSWRLQDADWPVRRAAASGLHHLLQFVKALSEELEDQHGLVKMDELQLPRPKDLHNSVEHMVLQPCLRLLQDPMVQVRQAALDLLPWLCQSALEDVVRALHCLLQNEQNAELRRAAEKLLDQLTSTGTLQSSCLGETH